MTGRSEAPIVPWMPKVAEELEAFVARHRACGEMTGDATNLTPTGYLVWISCPCGARFERWVGEAQAQADLGERGDGGEP